MPTYSLKKLSEICWKASSNISQNQLSHNEGEFPIYGAGGLIKNVNFYHQPNEYIAIVKDGAGVGRLVLLPAQSSVIGTMQYILPWEWINIKFLYYSLLKIDFLKYKQGSTIPHIYFKDYSREEIPLPPLSVQEEIVAKLDAALASIEEAKTKTQQALVATRELWESTLEEAFCSGHGWDKKKLWEVLDFHNWFAFKSSDVIQKSNTQLIRMGNLYGNKLDLDRRAVFYPDEFAKQYAKYLLSPNDLVISLTWTTGKEDYWYAVRIPETKYKLLLNQRIAKIVILDDNKTLKTFILYFLLSRVFLDNLYRTANWTRQANLSTDTMKEMIFLFPNSLSEQSRIVDHLDVVRAETDRLASLYEKKLVDLDELRRSVLQEAFTLSD